MSRIIKGASTRELMERLAAESEHLSVRDRRDFLRKGIAAVSGVAATAAAGAASAGVNTANLPPP